jgi:hypothetical protein
MELLYVQKIPIGYGEKFTFGRDLNGYFSIFKKYFRDVYVLNPEKKYRIDLYDLDKEECTLEFWEV